MNDLVPYQRILHSVREEILSGQLHGRLPTIAALSERFAVNSNTIKKVLDRLKNSGLIYGHRGKGTFVNREGVAQTTAAKVAMIMSLTIVRNPFYLHVFAYIKKGLEKQGVELMLLNDFEPLWRQPYDFVVLFDSPLNLSNAETLLSHYQPGQLLLINQQSERMRSVGNDNVYNGRMAIQYLYNHGHRRVGVISRDLHLIDSIFFRRMAGVTQFADEHPDLHLSHACINMNTTQADESRAADATAKMLDQSPNVTAIFAFTDVLALGVLSHLQKRGIAVPSDISLLGYDNRDFSSLLNPALTTLEEPAEKMAERAVSELMGWLNRKCSTENSLLRARIIERQSVATYTTTFSHN